MRRFKLLEDAPTNTDAKAGSVVNECVLYDYGLSSDDARGFGEPCISVTLDSQGGYPFFVVKESILEEIEGE